MIKCSGAKLLHFKYKVMNFEDILNENEANLRKPQGPAAERFVPLEEISYDSEDSELGLSPDEILARKEEAELADQEEMAA
jgi:hypothetical protein